MPARQESRVGAGADRLDLRPQRRQRSAAKDPQYVGVTPLVTGRLDGELAADQPPIGGQPAQHVGRYPQPQPEPGGDVGGGERRVGAGVSAQQLTERIADRLGEAGWHADRHGHPHAVAQSADVLDRDPPALSGKRNGQRAFGGAQSVQPAADVGAAGSDGDFFGGQRAKQPQ